MRVEVDNSRIRGVPRTPESGEAERRDRKHQGGITILYYTITIAIITIAIITIAIITIAMITSIIYV